LFNPPILGAAEPRYVLQSPGLVENCVGLYVPLLELTMVAEKNTSGCSAISQTLSNSQAAGELMADIRLSFAVNPTVYWVGVIV
jgi:hypothetical protein